MSSVVTLPSGSHTSSAGMGPACSMTLSGSPPLPASCSPHPASDLRIGCYFQGLWYQNPFPFADSPDLAISKNWHELSAATMALALWGSQYASKCILIHCNNSLVVHTSCGLCSTTWISEFSTFQVSTTKLQMLFPVSRKAASGN